MIPTPLTTHGLLLVHTQPASYYSVRSLIYYILIPLHVMQVLHFDPTTCYASTTVLR
jgi:hypothetical protein